MSVVLEKDKIIISVHSNNPEDDLSEMQSDIIFAIQNFDHEHQSYSFYKLLDLLEAMVPDRKTYQQAEEETTYNMKPLLKLLHDFPAHNLNIILSSAITYLYKYGAMQIEKGEQNIDLEDTVDSLKSLSEAFLQMAKEDDKVGS